MEINRIVSNENLYRTILDFQKEQKLGYGTNVKALCKKLGFGLIPYTSNHALTKISKDGFSIYKKNEFYIFYNKSVLEERTNFTIAHEIGHIILCHHFIEKINILMYGKNTLLEKQANTFAQNILMPADKMKLLKNHDIKDVANYFAVSYKMAEVRLNRLKEDMYYINKINQKNT